MQDVYIGRQPIMDQFYKVKAYELLFRPTAGSKVQSGQHMTAQVMVNLLTDIGLETLAGTLPVYVNVPDAMLLDDITSLLPPEKVCIEILEDAVVNDELIAACKRLKEQGYTILLDDFTFEPQFAPLLEIADIVKVDILATQDRLAEKVASLRPYKVQLLAEKVETYEQHEMTKNMGFTLFQGYFFCHPEVVKGTKLPDSKIAIMQALQQVMTAEAIEDIEGVVKRDVGLSYRLLKYINSAAFGMRREIESVNQALTLLGLSNIRRWLSLLSLASLGSDKPAELVRMAMLRGRILEGIAGIQKASNPADYFVLGMFSLLDALLDQTMDVALQEIALPADIIEGLTNSDSRYGRLLALVVSIEHGDWDHANTLCQQSGMKVGDISAIYADAVHWVDENSEMVAA
ncbi:MAG: HDOD domain-containing protein [Mariprofundaceae bacterium]